MKVHKAEAITILNNITLHAGLLNNKFENKSTASVNRNKEREVITKNWCSCFLGYIKIAEIKGTIKNKCEVFST